MNGHPFALILSDRYGRHHALGMFTCTAYLWTFWTAWKADALPGELAEARFAYYGQAHHVAMPHATREACRAWGDALAGRRA